jgi:nucleotide-binding universal stress UspA family protein
MKIVVAVDGSAWSTRAVEWCAEYAPALKGEVVVVHSVDIPVYVSSEFGIGPIAMPMPPELDRDELRDVIEREWCAPLTKANVSFRVELTHGSPAPAIMAVAEQEAADLVVVGRRGRGGFAELLLGSTSHHLSHHLGRPLLIVS